MSYEEKPDINVLNAENTPLEDNQIQPDMDVDESFEEQQPPEESSQQMDSEEDVEKSRIQKETFLEMFRIAPRVKDVLPDLKIFMTHPDVIDWDRREVEHLVELKIQEEKAKKKAEKEKARRERELAERQPVGLADAIKSATGINIAGLLQKPSAHPIANPDDPSTMVPGAIVPIPGIPEGAVVVHGLPQGLAAAHGKNTGPILVARLGPPPPKIISVGHGKCGFDTPHPNDIPAELRHAKPDMVAPIPDELRVLPTRGPQIAPIPNELLPPEQRVFESLPIVFVRPPLRKTLFLAGARAGKRCERIKEQEKKEGKKGKNKKRKNTEDLSDSPDGKKGRNNGGGGGRNQSGGGGHKPFITGMNALPAGLNKNSPLAVKRYHARQLAKETGITLEEAMNEIEEQCREFGGEDTPEAREHDEKAMEMIRKRGEEKWNQRYNWSPADHSKGIPGVDRPPMGDPSPPKGPRRGGPPAGGPGGPPGDRDQESYGGYPRDEPIPGIDRPPGGGGGRGGGMGEEPWNRRRRGGVKEREKREKRRNNEMSRGGGRGGGNRGGRGGRGGGYDGYDDRGGYGGGGGQGRYGGYDDYGAQQHHRPYAANSSYDVHGAYDDRRAYDDYYGGHEASGYENYDQYGGYEGQHGGEHGNYEYDQHTAEAYYQQHGGQDSTYYQEDGSQYYNEYYGTSEGGQGGPSNEYHATFDKNDPPTPSSSPPHA